MDVSVSPLVARLGTYPFVRLDEARRRVEERGVRVIDFGMGDPRERADERIERALVDALPNVAGYPRAHGLPALREAIAGWVGRRFGAPLDPDTEVVPTLGSKEAIYSLAQVALDPAAGRSVVAYTEPGYPVYERGALFAGAETVALPLREEHGFLPELDAVGDEVWRRVAVLWLNYPNNPTGAVCELGFLERVADLARRHGFVLACDEPYTELWFDERPPSALQLSDRTNVLAFNSLSKRSSLTGYRSGFVAGDPELIAALKTFRPSIGTAPQEFVQHASVVAWNDEEHVERIRAGYARKRGVLVPALEAAGLRVAGAAATMYLWCEVPGGEAAEAFAERLLEERGLLVSPGPYFGLSGEGYVRLSLVPTLEECEQAAAALGSLVAT
jgi:acetylornithine aminotransferase